MRPRTTLRKLRGNELPFRNGHSLLVQSIWSFPKYQDEIEHGLNPKPEINPATVLPSEYHEFLDVFSKKEADKLPERRSYDHKIPLMEGKEPTYSPLYGMSRDELLVLQKYLTET